MEPIKTAHLRLFGHMKKVTDIRLPKKVGYMNGSKRTEEKRKTELTLTQDISLTIRERGLEDEAWEGRAG